MAIITISTDTFLDNGTARVAGDTWSITSGAKFTVRTDSRWYAACPAGLTGTVGSSSIDASKGGTFFLEGRNVRWMAFDTGAGNVPAIGTSITQGGVTGYLLGVWTSLTATPSTPGTAMPVTGFIKFREVTGGQFTAGALTGIGANASSPDVTGWIEVVYDQGASFAMGPAATFQARGDWFYLDNTTGVAGQTIQTPTCGGGANSSVPAVQIETAPGSGVFEWYSASVANSTTAGFIAGATGTDERSKLVQWVSGGMVRIGSDGTTTMGYVPAAGCKVRIPNIIIRQALNTARSANVLPNTSIASRARMTTLNSGGIIDLDRVMSDLYQQMVAFNSCTMVNCALESSLLVQTNKGPGSFTDVCIGANTIPAITTAAVDINALVAPVTFTRTVILLAAASTAQYPVKLYNSSNVSFDTTYVRYQGTRTTAITCIDASGSSNCSMNNTYVVGGTIRFASCSNITMTNTDYTDRMAGTTTATAPTSAFSTQGLNVDLTFDGLTLGFQGRIANVQPYNYFFTSSGVTARIKVRNFGTFDSPVNSGSSSTFYPSGLMLLGATDTDSKYQRIYATGTRSVPYSLGSIMPTNCVFEHIYSFSSTLTFILQGTKCIYRSIIGPTTLTTSANLFGVNWGSVFTSGALTTGSIFFVANEPSDDTIGSFGFNGTVKFTGSASIYLKNIGDYMTAESPYFMLGHTGLANTAPAVTASNAAVTYQINKGAGYNGVWKTLNAATLSAETGIDPAIGIRMMLKITATAADATFTSARIATTSTTTAQTSCLYPLDTTTLSFEGLIPGSEVRAYVGSLDDPASAVEIGGIESTSGSTWSFTHTAAGQQGYINILAMGYQPVTIPRTYQATDSTLLIQPVIDRNYRND